ncbi:hypothetical protein I4U23_022967 [Adineta vaga]|nr:hypothetical protein I4U23_022967 [Adineta vaga]
MIDDFVLLKLNSTSAKDIDNHVTTFLDLSDQILLQICRYLSSAYILFSFYTPEHAEFRLHRLICNYYKKIKFDQINNNEYNYIRSLLCYSSTTFRPESLVLSNEHINCLIERFFSDIPFDILHSIFYYLKELKLIHCSQANLRFLRSYERILSQLESLHINIRQELINDDDDESLAFDTDVNEECYISLARFLFNSEMFSLHTISIEYHYGIILNKSLIPHQTLRNVNLFLQTIDDLFILLDGLIPNVQTMIIHLIQPRILACNFPIKTSTCLQLTKFSLFEHRIGLLFNDLKIIFSFMPNLIDLTLSIRDTPDPSFCHGSLLESILKEYFPRLHSFDYTMTHRIIREITSLINFTQWSMNSVNYINESDKWIHLYSYPWPSNKDDQRRLPLVQSGCYTTVKSDVKRAQYIDHLLITKANEFDDLYQYFIRTKTLTTGSMVHRKLPSRISKLILTKYFPILTSSQICIQPTVRHLIVERRLTDENELIDFAYQFPNVQYFEILFPSDHISYNTCLKRLFDRNEKISLLSKLFHFTTQISYVEFASKEKLFDWLIQNTYLKYHPYAFYVHLTLSKMFIWF